MVDLDAVRKVTGNVFETSGGVPVQIQWRVRIQVKTVFSVGSPRYLRGALLLEQ